MKRRINVPTDLAAITTVGAEEDPQAVGMTTADVEAIWAAVVGAYRTGAHPAMALCLRRDGQVILDRAIGHAHGNGPDDEPASPKVLATPDTPFGVFSASKAMTATVVHLLAERGALRLTDRVADHVPAFAANGKADITIGQVLSHRSGLRLLPDGALDLDVLCDTERLMQMICAMEPDTAPGARQAYHAISGGFILGEVVRRATGAGIDAVLADSILQPLGFRWLQYGAAAADVPSIARNYPMGKPLSPRVETKALGAPLAHLIAMSNDPRWSSVPMPAANTVATANELSRFYELLRCGGELDGVRVFEPDTLRRALGEPGRATLDGTLHLPIRFSGGFMLGAKRIGPFGPDTPNAFGHPGLVYMPAWADPDRALSGALLTTGKAVVYRGLGAFLDVMTTISKRVPSDRNQK